MKNILFAMGYLVCATSAYADSAKTIVQPFSGTIEVVGAKFSITSIELTMNNQFRTVKAPYQWSQLTKSIPLVFEDLEKDGKKISFASKSTVINESFLPANEFNNCGFKLVLQGVDDQRIARSVFSTVEIFEKDVCVSERNLAEMVMKNISETTITVRNPINSDYLMIVGFFDDYYWQQNGRGGRGGDL